MRRARNNSHSHSISDSNESSGNNLAKTVFITIFSWLFCITLIFGKWPINFSVFFLVYRFRLISEQIAILLDLVMLGWVTYSMNGSSMAEQYCRVVHSYGKWCLFISWKMDQSMAKEKTKDEFNLNRYELLIQFPMIIDKHVRYSNRR